MMTNEIYLDMTRKPQVLLLGNGLLRLAGGGDWSALLNQLTSRKGAVNLKGIPYAMQPEALCGPDVEEVQRQATRVIENSPVHRLLAELLQMDFDAILTTNFTYEIEEALTGKPWTEETRRESLRLLSPHTLVYHNTRICNLVTRADGRKVPVFHVHGEKGRKDSLVLNYYSYAKSVSRLCDFNLQRGNQYREYQQAARPLPVESWLDYFLMGDVYSVGLSFDISEFDLWWAVERKARELAKHGRLYAMMSEKLDEYLPQYTLFEALDVNCEIFDTVNGYEAAYTAIIGKIKAYMNA